MGSKTAGLALDGHGGEVGVLKKTSPPSAPHPEQKARAPVDVFASGRRAPLCRSLRDGEAVFVIPMELYIQGDGDSKQISGNAFEGIRHYHGNQCIRCLIHGVIPLHTAKCESAEI